MKTENTLENKAKFFAQYWGQHVLYFSSDFLRRIDNLTLGNIENDDYYDLLLYEPIDSAIVLSDYMEKIGLERWMYINADCSDRYNDVEMVRDLKDLGWFNIHKVNKWKGINWRIGKMKQKRINIVANTNAKREQENYKWREVNGIAMNEPVDKFNHFWDGAGYAKLGWLKLNGNY